MNTCSACRYFEETDKGKAGECRMNPPRAQLAAGHGVGGPTMQVVPFFPPVRVNQWCGMWIARST